MKLVLAAVGEKMPAWVGDGFEAYRQRLPRHLAPRLVEVPVSHRGKNPDLRRLKAEEGERLLAALPEPVHRVALDGRGKPWTTEQLAQALQRWMQDGQDVALLIGGPDGLSKDCLDACAERWSLGPLTLPHPLVRVIVAEQIYRAWSILENHPYHRGG